MPSRVMLVCLCRTENMPSREERLECFCCKATAALESELRVNGHSTLEIQCRSASPSSGCCRVARGFLFLGFLRCLGAARTRRGIGRRRGRGAGTCCRAGLGFLTLLACCCRCRVRRHRWRRSRGRGRRRGGGRGRRRVYWLF